MLKKFIIFSAILSSLLQVSTTCLAETNIFTIVNQTHTIPAQIKAPAESSPVLTTHAIGYQIYQCTLTKQLYNWILQGPDAKLLDINGQGIGKHYLGPIWELNGTDRLTGKIINRFDVDNNKAIAWLLVKVVAYKGKGNYSDVHYINRINTQGGLPPSKECDANHLGSEKRVGYTADYILYK